MEHRSEPRAIAGGYLVLIESFSVARGYRTACGSKRVTVWQNHKQVHEALPNLDKTRDDVTLVELDIINRFLNMCFSPQVPFTTTICPRTTGTLPRAGLSKLPSGVRLQRIQDSARTTGRRDHWMDVISPYISYVQPPTANLTRLCDWLRN